MDKTIDKYLEKLKGAADSRTRKIRNMRAKGMTFDAIGKELGISRQRAKQIHDRSICE